jgi:hypothetical protein
MYLGLGFAKFAKNIMDIMYEFGNVQERINSKMLTTALVLLLTSSLIIRNDDSKDFNRDQAVPEKMLEKKQGNNSAVQAQLWSEYISSSINYIQ